MDCDNDELKSTKYGKILKAIKTIEKIKYDYIVPNSMLDNQLKIILNYVKKNID